MEDHFISFKKNTKEQDTKFVKKVGFFLLALIQIPVLFEILVGSKLNFIFALLTEAILIIGLILNNFKKTYFALAIVSIYLYGLFAAIPYFSDILTVTVPVIIAVFVTNTYAINKQSFHHFNLIAAVVSLCIFFNAAAQVYTLNFQYFANMSICTISFTIIFAVIFYFKRDVRRYQKKLEKNITFLKQIIDANPHFVYTTDNQNTFTFINETMRGFDEESQHDLIGENANDFWKPFYNKESLKENENATFVLKTFKNAFHQIRFHEVFQTALLDSDGVKIGNLGVSIDVTEKRKAQIKLEESELNYRTLFENHQLAIVTANNGIFTKVNNAFCKMTGYEKSEIIGKHIFEIMYFEDYNDTLPLVRQVENNEVKGYSFEHRFIRKDQSVGHAIVHIHITSKVTFKNSSHIMATLTDISKLKATEAALTESEAIYRTLVNYAFDGIEIHESISPLKPNGKWTHRMILRNNQIYDILGNVFKRVKKESFSFKDILSMSPEYQRNGMKSADVISQLKSKFQKNMVITFEWQYGNSENSIDTEMTLIRFKIGEKKYIASIYKDVTEQKKAELKLQKSKRKIEQKNKKIQRTLDSNAALEKFAFSVSHELKGPLKTLTGYANLLKKIIQNSEEFNMNNFVNEILNSSKSMEKVINKFLLFARLDTKKIELSKTNLNVLFTNIEKELQSSIDLNEVTLRFKNKTEYVFVDPTLFQQLLHNLISNAIKYRATNRPPEVTIEVSEKDNYIIIKVIDNGIGIDSAHHESIFNFFEQVDASSNKGTGIGLALCKKIVEHHQGEIGVQSKLNEGSTFYFSIYKNLQNISST